MRERNDPNEPPPCSSLAATADAVRNGDQSAEAVIGQALARAERLNPELLAFTELYGDEARERARELDRRLAGGHTPGALAGVPVAVKDFTPLAGKRTTYGSLVHKNNVGTFDPVYVQRLRAADAIIIGKTNTPEFAFASFCRNRVFGTTRNPWNLDHTPGGSSGGSAAAVASGCVPVAEGTDMGGSVRIPAAWCGIVGLKPSLGRIPMDILPSVYDTISHFGPLSATVEDTWRFLRAVAGPHDSDPLSLPDETIPFDRDAGAEGLRVALSTNLGFYAVDDATVENLHRTADMLREAGAVVEPVTFDWDAAIYRAINDHWCLYLAAFQGHLLERCREKLDPEVVEHIERGLELDGVTAKRFEIVRTRMWRDLCAIFQEHEALLCPTVPFGAPPIEHSDRDYGQEDADGRVHALDLTSPFNMTPHCPAISVPTGLDERGLPLGMQLVGHRFDEATVLRLARCVERARE